jgi:hypothetical protein
MAAFAAGYERRITPRFRSASAAKAHGRANDRRSAGQPIIPRVTATPYREDTTMFRTLAAAAIAASLIASPVFAQGSTSTTTAPKASVTTGVAAKDTGAVNVKPRKHVSMSHRHRHHVRHVVHMKRAKHAVHAKHLKHLKQVTRTAPAKVSGKAKISG